MSLLPPGMHGSGGAEELEETELDVELLELVDSEVIVELGEDVADETTLELDEASDETLLVLGEEMA
jgi:hypothetical protein